MQQYDEENLTKLQSLLENRLTKADFIKGFEQVINLVLKVQKDQSEAISRLEETHKMMLEKMRGDNSMSLTEIKGLTSKHIAEYTQKHTDTISQKMAEVKNGKDADEKVIVGKVLSQIKFPDIEKPEQIRIKLETLKGDQRIDKTAIRGLEKIEDEIKRIDNKPTGGGFRASHSTKFHSLTADGSTKIFAVPKSVTSIVLTSDTPFILFENSGFTINKTRTQITLTADIAPSNGAQLLYQYVEYFNT